jgi:hypothetical protein
MFLKRLKDLVKPIFRYSARVLIASASSPSSSALAFLTALSTTSSSLA